MHGIAGEQLSDFAATFQGRGVVTVDWRARQYVAHISSVVRYLTSDKLPVANSGAAARMKRRKFIQLLWGALAWPTSLRAQHTSAPVIGFLSARSPDESAHLVTAFRRGLSESSYVEGQTVTVEYRWAHGQYDRLPALAAELVRRPVALLVATGGEPAALAATAATTTIPIVFTTGGDPVKQGLVASFNRPGGNATGIGGLATTLEAKRLGLLRELVPQAATVGVLLNPRFQQFENQLKEAQQAAQTLKWQIHILRASTDREIESEFESVFRQRIAALTVAADPFFDTRRDKLAELAARYGVPTMYQCREYAVAGGLISYGISFADVYREVGRYAGRILKGAKPAELPVQQPTKIELVINLKTAKALGIAVPPSLLARAEEVIE